MMNREQFLLTKLSEECHEVGQMALKTQQFGMNEVYEVLSNRERLHGELNDLWAMVQMLNDETGLMFIPDPVAIKAKMEKINKYYQYSKNLGLVE